MDWGGDSSYMQLYRWKSLVLILLTSCIRSPSTTESEPWADFALRPYRLDLSGEMPPWLPGMELSSPLGVSIISFSSRNPGDTICVLFQIGPTFSEEAFSNVYRSVFGADAALPEDDFFNRTWRKGTEESHFYHFLNL